jgi:Sec-independent protein secretion pathway component TatC
MEIIIAIVLVFIAGMSNGYMDTLQFHYMKSIFKDMKNQRFFNPRNSWKNKYKWGNPKKGPKFFGSTTFLVFTTDAWHLFQFIMLTSFFTAMVLYTPITNYLLIDFIGLRLIYWLGFKLGYK